MKNKIRLQFGNDVSANQVADFATYLLRSRLLKSVSVDEQYCDTVDIVFDMSGDIKTQYFWVTAGLTKWTGWEFVGDRKSVV